MSHILDQRSIPEPYFFGRRSTNRPHFRCFLWPCLLPSLRSFRQGNAYKTSSGIGMVANTRLASHISLLCARLIAAAWPIKRRNQSINGPHFQARPVFFAPFFLSNARISGHFMPLSGVDRLASFSNPGSTTEPQSNEYRATLISRQIEYRASFSRLVSHKNRHNSLISTEFPLLNYKKLCLIKKIKTETVCCFLRGVTR